MVHISRRTGQIATLVAVLSVMGGFAVATISGGPGSTNSYNVIGPGVTGTTYSTTAWSVSAPPDLTQTLPTSSTGSVCVAGLKAAAYAGDPNGACDYAAGPGDQVATFSYTQAAIACPTSPSDTFTVQTVTSAGTGDGTTSNFVVYTNCQTAGGSLTLYVDLGTTSNDISLTSITVTITQTTPGSGF